jgi:uncharacterized protein (DUF2236 family)
VEIGHRGVLGFGERLVAKPLQVPLALLEPVRRDLRRNVRRSLGVSSDPPVRVSDPADAFLPPGAVARRVHGDLPAMVSGGLAALLLQMLHPLTMAGVAEHSAYREDAIGRLRRTAAFIGATTFGSVDQATEAIERVRRVHDRVHGVAPDGRPYSANDPELLTWVHVAGTYCFLRAARRYGPGRITPADADRYYEETASVARALGADWVPESADETDAYLKRMRPELYAGPQALAARDFLLRGVAKRANDRALYAAVVASSLAVLPPWARSELRIPAPPLVDDLVVTPLARTFCAALRWMVSPPEPVHV